MGYQKIVQFGNVTEVYKYDKNIYRNGQQNWKKHATLAQRWRGIGGEQSFKSKSPHVHTKKRIRSRRSVNRSRFNFFRVVHHNNCFANTITFVTLTFAYEVTFKEANQSVQDFFKSLRRNLGKSSISFIGVPELTKKKRYHFHLLIYDLPPEVARLERKTRNLQRQFKRGYVDAVSTTYTSKGIAGYMAKYLQKSFDDERYENTRGYNCSRNIKKIASHGSNALSGYDDLLIPTVDIEDLQERSYDVPFLGRCYYTKITTKHES